MSAARLAPGHNWGQEGQHCPSLLAANGGSVPSCPSGKLWRYVCVQPSPRRWSQGLGLGLLGLCSTSSHLPGPAARLGPGAGPSPWVGAGGAGPLPLSLPVCPLGQTQHLLVLHCIRPALLPSLPRFLFVVCKVNISPGSNWDRGTKSRNTGSTGSCLALLRTWGPGQAGTGLQSRTRALSAGMAGRGR